MWIGLSLCPVFNRYFGSFYGVKMIVIPNNSYVNVSIFCAIDRPTRVLDFGESHVATLSVEDLILNFVANSDRVKHFHDARKRHTVIIRVHIRQCTLYNSKISLL